MSRIISTFVLSLVFFNVHAFWIEVTTTKNGTFYIDRLSFKWFGDVVQIKMLFDLHEFRKNHIQKLENSRTTINEYDCNEIKSRILEMNLYSDHMGKGMLLKNIKSPTKWTDEIAGSAGIRVLQIVCNDRRLYIN